MEYFLIFDLKDCSLIINYKTVAISQYGLSYRMVNHCGTSYKLVSGKIAFRKLLQFTKCKTSANYTSKFWIVIG